MKPIDFSTPNVVTMLVYGTTDAGKTHFAASAIDTHKTLYLNTEEKTATLSKWASRLQNNGSRAFWIENQTEMRDMLAKFRQEQEKGYEVLVIDSLSRYQLFDQLNIMGNKEKSTFDDFGRLHVHMSQTMILVPKQTCHLIMTCQAEEYTRTFPNGSKQTRFRPALTGKFGSLIGGWFNIVAFLDNDGSKRVMHFRTGADFDAKNEFDLPASIDNPTFADVVKLVQ